MGKNRVCRALIPVFMIFILLFIFTACEEDDGSGHTFKYNLASNPQNLDPQLADDEESIIVIENMMSGLVKKNYDGSLSADAAESYTISEDGLIYTFELRKDIYWYSLADFEANMTADDFVYAFQRIYNSDALFSPYIDDFMCIKNASAVSNGLLSVDELGVTAESDYTLQIELEYPCFDFLEKLTLTGAKPCNKAFFEFTKGRYGLSAETSASNGAFYLKEWNYDPYWDNNYMILRRNVKNSENEYTYPYSLNFFIKQSDELSEFSNGNVDCAVVSNYDEKIFLKNQYVSYATKTYGLIFNTNSKYLSSRAIREALSTSFVRGISQNPDYISGCGIIPSGVTLMGRKYRELVSDESLNLYDKDKSFTVWNDELKKNSWVSIDGIKITVPESFGCAELISDITQQWQENLEFFCGVEVVSQNEYDLKLSEGTYDIALVEINSENGTANGYFDFFMPNDNPLADKSVTYAIAGNISQLSKADSLGEAIDLYTNTESSIINTYIFIPVCYGNEYLIYDNNTSDLNFDPITNSIDFKNAKYFD